MTTVKAKAAIAARLALGLLPDRLSLPLRPAERRFDLAEVPAPIEAPEGDVRLLVAPANFAGQGHLWARAAERLEGVGAMNMQVASEDGFGFAADYEVPRAVFDSSGSWARRQRRAVGSDFTHVLVEAERSMFGLALQGFVEREIAWLRDRGVRTGMVSHGTDLRSPHRHAEIDRWSPFRDADPEWVNGLERRAARNRAIFERSGLPAFVATPELLEDWPAAQWLPNVVDPDRWENQEAVLTTDRPVVLHAPTNPAVKGTALIEPALEKLTSEGIIDYQRILRIPSAEMPGRFAAADIVLDQFALGIYSTTSIEAMAAGRLVFAHLHSQVRDHIVAVTGLEPPIVEATPDSLEDLLRDVRERPEYYRSIARRGPAYVRSVHDGALSARVLAPFLGRELPQ
ncbi:hypothetical protein AB0N64_02760 [Microbacterium sp. NPDC089318]